MTPTAPKGPYVYQPHPVTRADGRLWHVGGMPDGLTREQAESIVAILNEADHQTAIHRLREELERLRVENQTVRASVDMLQVDRLRNWARHIEDSGPDISYWGSSEFVFQEMRSIADSIEAVIKAGSAQGRVGESLNAGTELEGRAGKPPLPDRTDRLSATSDRIDSPTSPCGHGWHFGGKCDSPSLATVLAEMDEALCVGALFNPEMFGSMLKRGDNPILRWRDTLTAERKRIAELEAQVHGLREERDGLIQDLDCLCSEHRKFVDDLRHHIVMTPEDASGLLEKACGDWTARAEAAEAKVAELEAQVHGLREAAQAGWAHEKLTRAAAMLRIAELEAQVHRLTQELSARA